jgi:hypothetical protein
MRCLGIQAKMATRIIARPPVVVCRPAVREYLDILDIGTRGARQWNQWE